MSGPHRSQGLRLLFLIAVAVLAISPWSVRAIPWAAPDTLIARTESPQPSHAAEAGSPSVFMPLMVKMPPPTVTPTPSPTAPAIYYDTFDDPKSGWPIEDDAEWRIGYLNGEYQILLKVSDVGMSVTPGFRCTDCAIEMDGRFASSSYGAYGIMFGITDGWDAYLFLVSAGQAYSLWKTVGVTSEALVEWTYSPHIRAGQGPNHLRVERRGAEITLYANGQQLKTLTDDSFLGSLRVGAVGETWANLNVDVRLDNFAVYSLGGALEIGSSDAIGSAVGVAHEVER